jgi:Endonuclease/Exonuclease/phosphatase family
MTCLMWRNVQKLLGVVLPVALLLLYTVVGVCLLNRWDSAVPITLVPIWVWSIIGMTGALVAWFFDRTIKPLVIFFLYLFTGVGLAEETHGIIRELAFASRGQSDNGTGKESPFRVISLNCGGSELPLRRVANLKPDLLLLQQAPGEGAILDVANDLYGVDRSFVLHGGSAILTRGIFLSTITVPETSTIHVRLQLTDGSIIDVTNLSLPRCAPHLSMWQPTAWGPLVEARQHNRRLVRTYLGENRITRSTMGRIIGGDFGTPPGDDVFRPLQSAGLLDSFAGRGVGWGNTDPPAYAVLRLDQIWISDNFAVQKASSPLIEGAPRRAAYAQLRLPRPPAKKTPVTKPTP